jgi:hypothetical protein
MACVECVPFPRLFMAPSQTPSAPLPVPKKLPNAVAAALIKDFRSFLKLVWEHLGLPIPTDIQYDIADNLQNGPKRLVIEAFRGVGKSWITSALVCWLLMVDSDTKVKVVSASKGRADDFSIFTKRLINEIPSLANLRPREGQRSSNLSFDVGPAGASHAPSVSSAGITGQLTGSRADVIIADDIEVPGNSATALQREKLSNLVKEFEALLSTKPNTRIIFLGTPQTEMSVYNELRTRGYVMMVWPARYPTQEQAEKYGGTLAPYITERMADGRGVAGTPTDPKRFTHLDLLERELSYGRSGFALQFMLDTSLSDADRYPLKLSDLIVLDVPADVGPINLAWANSPDLILSDLPMVGLNGDRYLRPMWRHDQMAPWQGTAMAVDPSGRGKDELAYAVGHMLHSRVFIPRNGWGGLPGGYEEKNLERLVQVAKQHKVKYIVVESNFGDGMFTTLLRSALVKYKYPCTVEEVNHSVQKEKRICDTLEPVMNAHRLVVDRTLVSEDYKSTDTNEKRGFYQMSRLTREKGALRFDDRIDVLAMLVKYWVTSMERDTGSAQADAEDEAMRRSLVDFEDHVFGRDSANSANNWNSAILESLL